MGCPIRKSTDQHFYAAPRSLSQLGTSFIATVCLGIHRTPLSTLTLNGLHVHCTIPNKLICSISSSHPNFFNFNLELLASTLHYTKQAHELDFFLASKLLQNHSPCGKQPHIQLLFSYYPQYVKEHPRRSRGLEPQNGPG